MSETELYREHRVIRRTQQGVIVYVCFERIDDGRFIVQQAEFVHGTDGAGYANVATRIAVQTLELFAEGKVTDTRQWSASIAEAIGLHDREFGN
jgi:hypothetical protein